MNCIDDSGSDVHTNRPEIKCSVMTSDVLFNLPPITIQDLLHPLTISLTTLLYAYIVSSYVSLYITTLSIHFTRNVNDSLTLRPSMALSGHSPRHLSMSIFTTCCILDHLEITMSASLLDS